MGSLRGANAPLLISSPLPLIREGGNSVKRGWRFSATLLNSPWERNEESEASLINSSLPLIRGRGY
jgi:hypothetical protein